MILRGVKAMVACAALLGGCAVAEAEIVTVKLPAQVLIDQFADQKISNATPERERKFTFISDGIDWTLTFVAPQRKVIADSDIANYGSSKAGSVVCFGLPAADLSEYKHIESFSLESDYFANKKVTGVSVAAALLLFGDDDARALPVELTVGTTTMSATPTVATTLRSKIQTLNFQLPEAESGKVVVSSTFPGGAQFAFIELSVSYEQASLTADAVMGSAVNVGHIVELSCDDQEADIYYAVNDGAWQKYDAENGVVLAQEGEHELSYYSEAPGKRPSAVVKTAFAVKNPGGLDYALTLANPVKVSGYVVGHGEGYTLIGKSATADEANCLALDNSEYVALRNAITGTAVSASGRATSNFERAGLDHLTDLYVDGRKIEPSTSQLLSAKARVAEQSSETYDLQGRRSTRSRIAITSAGEKFCR